MSSKYIPPHARKTAELKSNDDSSEKPFRSRRQLKQSEFNVRTSPTQISPPLVIPPIEIPTPVEPPIVISPIEKKSWKPSQNEIKLMENLEKSRSKRVIQDIEEWEQHYQIELENMYRECVNPCLNISYDDFVYAAYICTEVELDPKKFKYIRPLI
jgi:hypothetical protein